MGPHGSRLRNGSPLSWPKSAMANGVMYCKANESRPARVWPIGPDLEIMRIADFVSANDEF